MKKHIVLFAIITAAVVAMPALVSAQTNSASTSETKPKHGDYTPYQGKVAALDSASITVTTKSGDLKLNVTAETKILKNGAKAALTDFAVGDKVTGSYKKDASGSLTAKSIHEGKKAGNGAKKKKAASDGSTPTPPQ